MDAELQVWAGLLRQMVEFGPLFPESERGSSDADILVSPRRPEGAVRISIYRLSTDEGLMRCVAHSGDGSSKPSLGLRLDGSSLEARAAARGEPCFSSEVRPSSDGLDLQAETRSTYAIPLATRSGVLGVVSIECVGAEGIGPGVRKSASQTARKIALAIDRRRRLEMLRESEARFRSIFERGSVCIALLAAEGTVRAVNPAFAALLGSDASEFPGHSLMDFIVAEDAAPILEGLSRMRAGASASATAECRLLHPSGRVVWALMTISTLTSAGGKRADFLIVAHDIQGRKRAEAERVRLQERLAQSQKMKALGVLAGGVAHDFNNLLGVISGYISMLRTRLPREDPLQQVIATMQASAGRACELTQQLLHFSRQDPPRLSRLDISRSLHNVLKIVSQTFDRRIRMQHHLPPDLPPVMGDAGQLELALLNLCLNARDAMPEGGVLTLEASVANLSMGELPLEASGPVGDYVRIVIRDTGKGMDGEVISRIFEPFFTTKEDRKGAGLGLALVHGTIMHHQGFIGVRSQIGRGSEFTVHIPAAMSPPVPPSFSVDEGMLRSRP